MFHQLWKTAESRIDEVFYLIPLRKKLLIEIGLLIGGFPRWSIVRRWSITGLKDVTSWAVEGAFVVITLADLAWNRWDITAVPVDHVNIQPPQVQLPPNYDDYKWISPQSDALSGLDVELAARQEKPPHADKIAVYSDEVNEALWRSDTSLREDPQQFALTGKARSLASFSLRLAFLSPAILTNDRKVRLKSDLTVGDLKSSDASILVQQTRYFHGLATNELTGIQVIRGSTKQPLYDGASLAIETLSDGTRQLMPLSSSLCSNQIGVSTLAITTDRYLVIPIQSVRSAQSARLWAPSGSGSADWADVNRDETFKSFLRRAMERELRQECGISRPAVGRTWIMGYAREVNRGGLPEFFGFTLLRVTRDKLNISTKEKPFTAIHTTQPLRTKSPAKMAQELRELRRHNHAAMSFALWLNLFFAEYFLSKDDGAVASAIEQDRQLGTS